MAKHPPVDFRISAAACIGGALALLLLPLRWIAAFVIASAFHELCHFLALRTCGVTVFRFRICAEGAHIETEPMGKRKEMICALAGPLGSFLLVCMIRCFPLIGFCAGIQGLYNLLPVYPSDGGRVLQALLGEKAANIIGLWTILLLSFFGIYAVIRFDLGLGAVLLIFLLIRKGTFRKISCKDGRQGVQ